MKNTFTYLKTAMLTIAISLPVGLFAQSTTIIGNNDGEGNNNGKTFLRANKHDARFQYIILASELTTAGLSPGSDISKIEVYVTQLKSNAPYRLVVNMGHTLNGDLDADWAVSGDLTEVSNSFYAPTLNAWSGPTWTSNFAWDGNQNIVVQFCYDHPDKQGKQDKMRYHDANGPKIARYKEGNNLIDVCNIAGSHDKDFRPQFQLTYSGGSAPNQPGTITGEATPVESTTQSYSISAVSGATSYAWTVPTGWGNVSGETGTSISVTAGVYNSSTAQSGSVTVTASNANGNSSPRTLSVSPTAPAAPSSITGSAAPADGATGEAYSVTNVAGLSYSWDVSALSGWSITSGQGTNSIEVTVGSGSGNLSVTAVNNLGSSSAQTKAVAPVAELTVGTGTTASYWNPIESYYNYGYSANIYEASEINNSQTFNTLSWNVSTISNYANGNGTNNGTVNINGLQIYMAHISDATFDFSANCPMPTSSDNNLSDWTKVFDGNIAISSTGWYSITLDTKFDYNGTDHLLIYVYNEADATWEGDYLYIYSSSATNKDIYDYSDTYGSAFNGCSNYDVRPNIKLGYESDCSYTLGTISGTSSVDCGAPGNMTTTTLTLGSSGASTYQWQWRATGDTDWINCGNSTATASSYTTPYLGANTDYRVVLSDGSTTCYSDADGTSEYAVTANSCTKNAVWIGQTSTAWATGSNWASGSAPGINAFIAIGNEYANAPDFSASSHDDISGLDIQSGATLTYSSSAAGVPAILHGVNNAGTITHTGNGYMQLTSTATDKVITNTGTMTSVNIAITGSGTYTAGSNLSLNNMLISNGTLTMGAYTLTCAGGVQVTSGTLNAGSGGIDVTSGDFINGGSIDLSSTTLTLSGSSSQNITTNGITLSDVVINNSSGVVMQDAMTVSGNLTLTDGVINTNGNRLTMTSTTAGSLTGFDNTSFIIVNQAGPFRRHIASNTDTYAFPVGLGSSSTDYYRMDLVNGSLSGNSFTYVDVYPKTVTETGNNVDSRITATEGGTAITNMWDIKWMIVPDNEPSSGTLGLRLYIENISGLEDNKFTVFKRADNSTDYADYGNGSSTSTTIPGHNASGRTVASGYAEKTGFTPPLAEASGGSGNNNLPIQLLEFIAEATDNGIVNLIWITASEMNNEYFSIERSTDGIDFETVLEREGAGNSNQLMEYAAVDENPLLGTSYYRLKQTDYDGSFEYSELQAVNVLRTLNFSVRPNPATDRLQITFGEIAGGSVFVMTPDYKASIRIYNTAGKLVYKKKFDGNFYKFNIDVSNFDEGMYLVNLETAGQVYKTKFLKE